MNSIEVLFRPTNTKYQVIVNENTTAETQKDVKK